MSNCPYFCDDTVSLAYRHHHHHLSSSSLSSSLYCNCCCRCRWRCNFLSHLFGAKRPSCRLLYESPNLSCYSYQSIGRIFVDTITLLCYRVFSSEIRSHVDRTAHHWSTFAHIHWWYRPNPSSLKHTTYTLCGIDHWLVTECFAESFLAAPQHLFGQPAAERTAQ